MGMVAILVIWPTSFEQILSPIIKAPRQIDLMCPAAWEHVFESIKLSDLGQGSNNDLDIWHSYVIV